MKHNVIDTLIQKLQIETEELLSRGVMISIGDVRIIPKEIEVYRFQASVFEDDSVHQNELQQANPNHFYVHRFGKSAADPYKGRAGVDICLSSTNKLYYTWLIRAAVIEDLDKVEFITGISNLRKAILRYTNMTEKQLEDTSLIVSYGYNHDDVLRASRLRLSKDVSKYWEDAQLRFLVCDDEFKNRKFEGKEKPLVDFILREFAAGVKSKEDCQKYCIERLGYTPKDIKNL